MFYLTQYIQNTDSTHNIKNDQKYFLSFFSVSNFRNLVCLSYSEHISIQTSFTFGAQQLLVIAASVDTAGLQSLMADQC